MKNLDLVAMTSEIGTSCYREIEGEKLYDFKRVHIVVTNDDGSKKRYDIHRGSGRPQKYMHHIETHTIPADATWYDSERNKRWKWYDDSNFNTKLQKLAREISKTNHEIRIID